MFSSDLKKVDCIFSYSFKNVSLPLLGSDTSLNGKEWGEYSQCPWNYTKPTVASSLLQPKACPLGHCL